MKMRHAIAAIALLVTASTANAQNVDDHLKICTGDQFCESSQDQFKKWFPKAYEKDYQGQRNVSYCLATGCDGAVQQNRPLGCAWRVVIIASGSSRVDSTDTGFFDAYCRNRLSSSEMAQMRSQADALFRQIYKRPLPKGI